jgi:4-amino-4-deoxy-L-arabinose transferase-like glycosyltransferase
MNIPLPLRRAVLIVILILAATPYFMCLGASSLWDSNEAFYAETPREMIESGDYINPSFNYQPRFNKPPLCYWVVAFFYKLFGTSESVERITIALAALLMIATAFALGSVACSSEGRSFEGCSVEAGLFAAISLSAVPRFLMFSRRIMIDVYLAMFMSLTLLFFILAEKYPQRRRLFLALMYASAGLGVMTKGPVAAALPAIAFIIYLALYRRLNKLREMMLPMGIVIMAVIVLPWYVAIYQQHGWGYIQAFLLRDNLSRYTQPVWGPRRGLLFYIPVVLGDLFPWSFFLLPAIWVGARSEIAVRMPLRDSKTINSGDRSHIKGLLIIWVLVIVGFFSLSQNKEDLYILPIYPAASALVGGMLARFVSKDASDLARSPVRWAAVLVGILISLAGATVVYLFTAGAEVYRLAGVAALGYAATFGGLIAALLAAFKKRLMAIVAIAFTVIISSWIFVTNTLPDFERFKPVRLLCDVIDRSAAPDSLVGYYRVASPSMVFYLRRQIFEYYNPQEVVQAFGSGKEAYCLMAMQDYEAMKGALPHSTYVLASHPVFQVKLRGIFDKVEPPQVVIISNKGGIEIAR